MAGLKGGFIDELMTRARTNDFDDAGGAILSGRAMQNALNDNRVATVADGLLSGEERARLGQIIDELSRVEAARGRLPGVGGVMEGEPNSLVSLVARTIAARAGAKAGRGTSGASILTAHFASRRMQSALEALTLDRAEALIRKAVTGDRELFESLLKPVTQQSESRLIDVLTTTALGTTGGSAGASAPDDMLDAITRE